MRFSILSQLAYQFDQRCEVLLLLEAARGADQTIESDRLSFKPDIPLTRLDDALTGERRCVITAEGVVEIRYDAVVETPPRDAPLGGLKARPIRDLPPETLRFLMPSRYCPSDRFEPFVRSQFCPAEGGDKVEAMVAWIRANLTYRAGASASRTDALDTFIDRAGVCRDFSHLLISFCRASNIPARAVSAYAWGLEPPDLHAVVEVYLDGAWRMVDPTGLAPVDGLVRVATGADAADIAFMTIFGEAELLAQSFSVLRLDQPPSAAA